MPRFVCTQKCIVFFFTSLLFINYVSIRLRRLIYITISLLIFFLKKALKAFVFLATLFVGIIFFISLLLTKEKGGIHAIYRSIMETFGYYRVTGFLHKIIC